MPDSLTHRCGLIVIQLVVFFASLNKVLGHDFDLLFSCSESSKSDSWQCVALNEIDIPSVPGGQILGGDIQVGWQQLWEGKDGCMDPDVAWTLLQSKQVMINHCGQNRRSLNFFVTILKYCQEKQLDVRLVGLFRAMPSGLPSPEKNGRWVSTCDSNVLALTLCPLRKDGLWQRFSQMVERGIVSLKNENHKPISQKECWANHIAPALATLTHARKVSVDYYEPDSCVVVLRVEGAAKRPSVAVQTIKTILGEKSK